MSKIFVPDLTPHLEKIRLENEADKKRIEFEKLMQAVQPFSDKEMTEEATAKRIEKSKNDFWYFDKTYFPPEVYTDYAKPGKFHLELVELTELHDKKAHILHGPRDTGKSITYKKKFFYDFLFGKRRFMGFGSEIMPTSEDFLIDMYYMYITNERLLHDYKIDWVEQSREKIFARSNVNPKGTFVTPFSAGRSTKGRQRLFYRFDYIYITDFENATSSYTRESVQDRIDILNEARTSLSQDGTLIWEGNNTEIDSAMNLLFEEKEKGILSEQFEVHRYKAWDDSRPWFYRSIWYARFPADDEATFWTLIKPKDEYDKLGNYQGTPKKKSGDQFPDTNYHEYDSLPSDLKSVIYTDPNCSLKAKGDTTAAVNLGFSPSMQKFYIVSARCKSYSESHTLLKDFLTMKREDSTRTKIIGSFMDGNVAQESTWENNIKNFSRIEGFPFPAVTFTRYHVDDLVTPVSGEWKKDKFLFPPGFSKTEEGVRFLKQTFSFKTKKEKKKDDAPDSLISAYTALVEEGIAFSTSSSGFEYTSVSKRQIHKI